MRTPSAQQTKLLAGRGYATYFKVEVYDGATWRDLSGLAGQNFLISVEWSDSVDDQVSSATVTCHREHAFLSLAPLNALSKLNNLTGSYAPLLKEGRKFKIYIQLQPLSVGTGATWTEVFYGRIDEIDAASEELTFTGRDYGMGICQDTFIEVQREYGGATAGTAVDVETVIGQVLSDNSTGLGLYTPTTPGFAIYPKYQQDQVSVADAIKTLATLTGWEVRYKWRSDTSAFSLVFRDPDRTKSTPDWTYEPNQYTEVSAHRTDFADVRNAVTVEYTNQAATPPARASVSVSDATSIAAYGRRWCQLSESEASPITTSAQATALANWALSDLKNVLLEKEISVLFNPFIDVTDLIRIGASDTMETGDQDLACVSVSHRISSDEAVTTITCRGAPSLGAGAWLRRETRARPRNRWNDPPPPTLSVPPAPGGGTVLIEPNTGTRGNWASGFEIHTSTTSSFTPDTTTLRTTTKAQSGSQGRTLEVPLVGEVPGKTSYCKAVPLDSNGNPGDASDEVSFVAGRAKAGFVDSLVSQGHFPINGNFEHASDDLTSAPFDHWAVTAGTWGSSGDIYWGNDATFGNYVALRQTGGDPGIRSSAFPVRRAGGHFNIYLSVRPQGTLTAGRGLMMYVRFYRKSDLSDSPILFTKTVPYNVAAANVWTGYQVNSEFIGALPYDVNFCTIAFGKEAVSSAYGFDIGDVFFSEAEQYDLWCERLFVQGTMYGTSTGGSPSIYQPSWNAVTFENSFENFGSGWVECEFMKDSMGFVHVRGLAKRASAATNTTMFTLPAGYRPASGCMFACVGNGSHIRIDIGTDGTFKVQAAADANWNNFISLDGISFDTR
jgi:hypothetical protein